MVLHSLSKQLALDGANGLADYAQGEQRWVHAEQIRTDYGYQAFNHPIAGFRLTRWLYVQCWTGTERPSVLFDRATTWMLAQRMLLPGASVLERFVARLRDRVEARLWRRLGSNINETQQTQLAALLRVPEGARHSRLDELRTGPVTISGPALVRALERLQSVRSLGITIPQAASIPPSRIATLARFADKAKVSAVMRLPEARRLATLVAFIHTLEASAQDDALELLEMLLTEVFSDAEKEDKKARLRSLKDLDALAITLGEACGLLVDASLPDERVRAAVFAHVPRDTLIRTLQELGDLVRPPDDVFYQELQNQHRRVRRFMPMLLEHIHFAAGPTEGPLLAGIEYLRRTTPPTRDQEAAPLEVVPAKWRRHVGNGRGVSEHRAYTFCVLDQLRTALRRRDVFVSPSWRYADPRSGLLTGSEWQATRPMICRTLGLTANPEPVLAAMTEELDLAYRTVVARLPNNPAVRFERVGDRNELILTDIDKLDEPASLLALRAAVAERLPRVDLPEIILEIAARTRFAGAFTHVSERPGRAMTAESAVFKFGLLIWQRFFSADRTEFAGDTPPIKTI